MTIADQRRRQRPRRGRGRRSKRWLRAVTPFLVLLAIWVFTAVAHAVEEPDLGDPGTLSPVGTGPHGSSRLAEMLQTHGIRVDRVTSGLQALQEAATGDATVLVPAADFIDPTFVFYLGTVPGAHRVVVVEPGLRTLLYSRAPIYYVGERWATATVAPRCQTPYAVQAGRAAALHDRYVVDGPLAPSVDCYSGGLAGVRNGDTEIVYLGATDPLRNDRIGEDGNATLAVGLLSAYERLIWVDVHAREPVSLSPADLPNPQLPAYRRGERDRSSTGNPTIDAFPPALWAAVLLAFGTAVLVAIARARRLGPPVAEPLPVLVPAAEAVTGRGRLYERARTREATLDTLRHAAIARIAKVLNPFAGVAPERDLVGRGRSPAPPAAAEFIARVALRTGDTEANVQAILYGASPEDDEDLARSVAALDALVNAVLRANPTPAGPSPQPPQSSQPPQGGAP